jgi:AcrR family transcriptional regulator
MLETTSYRDLKVSDIAREAATSAATFYQYFPSVESAILVLAEAMVDEGSTLVALIQEHSWRGKAGYDTALSLVDGIMKFWDDHRSVFRVVDLCTEEGDLRFRNVRTKLTNTITRALCDVIAGFQREGRHPSDLEPFATAGVLVSMLVHVAAHRFGFEFWGIRTSDVRKSMARSLYWGVTGHRPPIG